MENVFDGYDSGGGSPTWWVVFSPLFISDALNAYFCVIVFIRMYIDVSLSKNLTLSPDSRSLKRDIKDRNAIGFIWDQ